MKKKYLFASLIYFTMSAFTFAQSESFTINKALFSSDKYDEFCPVYFNNGIVFCTNRSKNSLSDYSGSNNKGQYKLFYIDTTGKVKWNKSRLFSKDLTTRLNDGPATFNLQRDTIYFSKNIRTEGKLSDLKGGGNNLGVFFAALVGKKWGKIIEFRFNNDLYNVTTPYLSPDGSKLFFASDRPGGFGGSDIYYTHWKNGYWGDPVNLGPLINTKGNESYPYMNEVGELFFSSDGIPGLGGKDIFVTKQSSTGWYPPVHLDPPVNSKYNDFGIVTDPLMKEGYFSSDRGNSIDIFHFKANSFQFWFSEPQKENHFCFNISDTGSILIDTLKFKYVWSFDDTSIINGPVAYHCFPGSGKHIINLDLFDRKTRNLFFHKLKYSIEILKIDQPFITAPEFAIVEDTIAFDGLGSLCQGYTIEGYYWDFGDGTTGTGIRLIHKYAKSGEFEIRLALILKSKSDGKLEKRIVSKKIKVFKNEQERSLYLSEFTNKNKDAGDIKNINNIKIIDYFSAEADFKKESVFQVVLLSSSSRIDLNSRTFRNVPAKYSIKEIFDPDESRYLYLVDQEMTLMATYPAYNDMIAIGFKEASVRICLLKEPAEIDLYNIEKNYSTLTDNIFDYNNRLTKNAYIMLDQVVNLFNKYPNIKLEIGVHTDDQGPAPNLQWLSQVRAQIIVNYLTVRGINSKRLIAKGYADTKPIVSNLNTADRALNRRVDFTIVK
jgi:hypothetical protein